MKILIIDDSHIQRHFLREILEEQGHEIFEAHGAYTALGDCDSLALCNLIITDMRMPDGSGLEFLQGYSRTSEEPVPVLVHSSAYVFKAGDGTNLNLPQDIPKFFSFAEFHRKSTNGEVDYILDFIERNKR